jgi:hypothetical protein
VNLDAAAALPVRVQVEGGGAGGGGGGDGGAARMFESARCGLWCVVMLRGTGTL